MSDGSGLGAERKRLTFVRVVVEFAPDDPVEVIADRLRAHYVSQQPTDRWQVTHIDTSERDVETHTALLRAVPTVRVVSEYVARGANSHDVVRQVSRVVACGWRHKELRTLATVDVDALATLGPLPDVGALRRRDGSGLA